MTASRMTRTDYMAAMAVTWLPDHDRSGDVEVCKFTVDQRGSDLDRMTSMFSPSRRGRWTPPGEYTRAPPRRHALDEFDTPDERRDALPFIYRVEQEKPETVLVNGLGLGSIIGGLAHVPSVTTISSARSTRTSSPSSARTSNGSAGSTGSSSASDRVTPSPPTSTWGKGTRWDAAWHDIWPTISGDDYEEHKRMRRLYGRRVGFQEVWQGDEVRRLARQERSGRVYGGVWF